MESGTGAWTRAATSHRHRQNEKTLMLRALALTFATWALISASSLAETAPQPVPCNDFARSPAPHSGSATESSSGEDSAAENELLAAANRSRQLTGVPLLRVDESLRAAALAHAQRMVHSAQLEHQFPDEPQLLERIARVSPLKVDRAGENIAYADCAPRANEALMESPHHRENLLDGGFNVAGFAAIWRQGRIYVVQDFAHEVPTYSARQTTELVGKSVNEIRQQAGLTQLVRLAPPDLDQAACRLAESSSNARLIPAAYENRKMVTYTQSRPEILPPVALRLLRDADVTRFAVGSCYARDASHPAGTYWIAILLY